MAFIAKQYRIINLDNDDIVNKYYYYTKDLESYWCMFTGFYYAKEESKYDSIKPVIQIFKFCYYYGVIHNIMKSFFSNFTKDDDIINANKNVKLLEEDLIKNKELNKIDYRQWISSDIFINILKNNYPYFMDIFYPKPKINKYPKPKINKYLKPPSQEHKNIYDYPSPSIKPEKRGIRKKMRIMIQPQSYKFKIKNMYLGCKLCKKMNYLETDHINPPFKDLKDNFLDWAEKSNIDINSKEFKDLWRKYHEKHANFQLLCRKCHREKDDV